MKKVLFIAYYFPPMGGSGVQKSLKFVKYLSNYNYLPIVLTVNPRFTRWTKDQSLVKDIPPSTIVYRAPTIDMNWFFKLLWGLRLKVVVNWIQINLMIPDSEITWLFFAKRTIKKILDKHNIDIVYITAPPFSTLLIGPYLRKNHDLKYVVDFRDEWTNNPYIKDRNVPIRNYNRNKILEREVLEYCDGVIYTHPKFMRENFEGSYPFLKEKVNKIITNGFDEVDFVDHAIEQGHAESCKFKITYIGTFYDRRQPKILWEAIDALIRANKLDCNHLIVKIIGKNNKSFVLGNYRSNKNIVQLVEFIGNMKYEDALTELYNADMLLLFIAPGLNSKAEMPGKIFEYIRTYKPVLAIVPLEGAAAEILSKSRTGFIYDSSNIDEVQGGLLELFNSWKEGKLIVNPDHEYISKFNRESLTKLLASMLDEISSEHPRYMLKNK